ncbi:MAG: tRNA lysidine(34) synthetase TilS [Deltaproteobacteria bacterium]|nr:tRNA lysidine(34) synthetase TilS [Deltaproteobacteria bacterium]MBW2661837.1 tRNA lysidine(34) synthetase TilS [Deltaproteobacteria bacterium]
MPVSLKNCNKLLHSVKQTIKKHGMFQQGDSVLVCVSGGSDSVTLLHILHKLATEFSLRLGVAHLNHGLRQKDSDNDAKFVASLARELNLPCYISKEDVLKFQRRHKLSMEEAARRVRYAFYNKVAKKNRFNKIALGHNSNDNAELILMYLFRGSGPLGISGIPPVRNTENQSVQIVRPLIMATKSEISGFLEEKELKYVFDTSNLNTKYLRNRIRHNLIPSLKESYNPEIIKTLNRLASIIRIEEEWIEEIIEPVFKKTVLDTKNDKITLSVPTINKTHIAARRRIIRRAIAIIKGDLRRITFTHIDSIITLMESKSIYNCLDLPDRIRVELNKDVLSLSKEKKRLRDLNVRSGKIREVSFEYSILKPGGKSELIFIKELGLYLKFTKIDTDHPPDTYCAGHNVAFFDMDALSFPLVIRTFQAGDRFNPLGITGSQKVKKFLINNKIPKMERFRYPILLSKGKIIWVVGLRIADFVKVKPSTKIVLKTELSLA